MNRFTSIALLALAGLALAQQSQDPASDPAAERDAAREAARRAFYGGRIDAQAHQEMQGVWRIQRLEWDGDTWQGPLLDGMVLIDAGHMSIEIHAKVPYNSAEGIIHQSGLFQYRFNEVGELESTALIGMSNIDDLEYYEPIQRGTISKFRVRLTGDMLILTRPGSRMTLRREVQPNPPFHDRIERMKRAEGEAAEATTGGGR